MVAGTTVTRLPNGGTVQVKAGILRGVGPQGPVGPVGLTGPAGPTGPQGPMGEINDLQTFLQDSSSVATGGGDWTDAALLQPDGARNDLLVPTTDGFNIQFTQTGSYIGVLVARFEPATISDGVDTSTGTRAVRLVDLSGAQVGDAYCSLAAATTEPTVLIMPFVISPDPSKSYKLQGMSDDTLGVNLTYRSLTILRVGAGPAGATGPRGPLGLTGAQGPQGSVGDAGTGYATFNALIDSSDSSVLPGGAEAVTTDQGLRFPAGTQLPAIPAFMKRLAMDLEPLLAARYASAADRAAKRAVRTPGEVTVLGDSGVPEFRELNGNDNILARVINSASAPPSGPGQAAPGVLWVQT
jgi:hypothetical protein